MLTLYGPCTPHTLRTLRYATRNVLIIPVPVIITFHPPAGERGILGGSIVIIDYYNCYYNLFISFIMVERCVVRYSFLGLRGSRSLLRYGG